MIWLVVLINAIRESPGSAGGLVVFDIFGNIIFSRCLPSTREIPGSGSSWSMSFGF